MAEKQLKSVITCDLEGRIQTFNKGAEEVFGYHSEEVIGKKRVSVFSPGLVVLGHVMGWLKTAQEEGEYHTRTVFVRQDGTPFTADVRITPTFREGKQIGYCGVTVPRPDVEPAQAMPRISWATRLFAWMVITRAPFLTATIIPILIGAAWVVARELATPFPWGVFALVLFGGVAMHIAANTFNDYFDWTSGTDPANNDYLMPYTGGSRSIELGLISEKGLLRVAVGALTIASTAGLVLLALRGPGLLLFGLVGTFFLYFYTAPPLRLAARKGLGELVVGLSFGPLMVAGTSYALTGELALVDFFVGLPIGLLTTAILWINQFPDVKSDALAGKRNLVVVFGRRRARWGYLLLLVGAFGSVLAGVLSGIFPVGPVLMLAGLPLGVYVVYLLFRHYTDRKLIRANALTIQLHLLSGLLLAVGLFLSEPISRIL
jgi:1,4-dihydroxy-2-naphthoate octaprenyltransferase